MRELARIGSVLMVLAVGLLGCGSDSNDVLPFDLSDAVFTTFTDPASTYSTTEIFDVDNEIVRFDATAQVLVFDNRAFTGWVVTGNLVGSNGEFQVRFGTLTGVPRAYFTETGPATICDVVIQNDQLVVVPTTTPVPQT